MKRKAYLKPTMHVVKLQQQYHILYTSKPHGKGEDYEWDEDDEEEGGQSQGFAQPSGSLL